MKKSITGAVALLAGAFVAHSQGTVSFANLYVANPYMYVKLNGTANVGGTGSHTGTPADIASGSDWTVELYGNAGANDAVGNLVPAIVDGTTSTPVTANLTANNNGAYVGTWLSSAVADINGTTYSGQAATVAVAAWYNNGGTVATLAAAQAAGFANGFSGTGNVTTGGNSDPAVGGPPSTAPGLPHLGNINVVGNVGVPEPSTIALGVMGASAFLMRLRKKQ
jgi:hypothetical protein